jgi:hypothetical protein
MKKAEYPLLYIILRARKEELSIRCQIKGTTLSGKRFDLDNFKVSQMLEMALAEDGGASVHSRKFPGDGRSAYLSMHSQYQSTSKNETRVQEVRNKFKTLQYRATKNFPWDKFSNTLLSYHQELESMKAGLDKHTQVRDVVSMILHEKTKGIAAEIVATDKKAKKSLRHALAKIGECMALLGTLTQKGDDDQKSTPNRQIKKLKSKIKTLKRLIKT